MIVSLVIITFIDKKISQVGNVLIKKKIIEGAETMSLQAI